MKRMSRTIPLVLVVAGWLATTVAGFAIWELYESRPGPSGDVPHHADRAAGSAATWELVVYLHPHCPCSRATLSELTEIARTASPAVVVRVVFVRPAGEEEGWERGELWDTVTSSPGVQVSCDVGGAEAQRAGARTSGHLVVYDPAGRVAFAGGLTRARGRAGESVGRRSVIALLNGGEPEVREAPVFGCSLFNLARCGGPETEGKACPR